MSLHPPAVISSCKTVKLAGVVLARQRRQVLLCVSVKFQLVVLQLHLLKHRKALELLDFSKIIITQSYSWFFFFLEIF